MFTPTTFGRYFLVERLAAGGMGEVFRARLAGPTGIDKVLVIKTMLPQLARDADYVAMFLDEARVALALSHGNIAQCYELGRHDGRYFMAMEWVDGATLSQLLRSLGGAAALTPAEAAYVVREAARGLAYAHDRCDADGASLGIVHRDISPENVMVSRDGQVKLIDFGVARAAHRIAKTEAGVVKGKAEYMAPEQARADSERVGTGADVYALGVVLDELLGEDETLRSLAKACRAPEPEHRPSCAELVDNLTRYLAEHGGEVAARVAVAKRIDSLVPSASDEGAAAVPLPENDGLSSRKTRATAQAAPIEAPAPAPTSRGMRVSAALLLAASAALITYWSWPDATPPPAPPPKLVAAAAPARPAQPPAPAKASPKPAATKPALAVTAKPEVAAKKVLPKVVRLPRPAAIAVKAPGRVVINADPWARVYVNGKLRAQQTPLNAELPAGKHELLLVNGADPQLWSRLDLEVPPGGEIRRIVKLERQAEKAPEP